MIQELTVTCPCCDRRVSRAKVEGSITRFLGELDPGRLVSLDVLAMKFLVMGGAPTHRFRRILDGMAERGVLVRAYVPAGRRYLYGLPGADSPAIPCAGTDSDKASRR